MIGHDWLNAVEKMLPQSSRADDGLCVCRLLIMGRACGSIYFIFMSQMVRVVIFMDKLDVQNTSVSEAVCRMLSLELLPPYPDPSISISLLSITDPGAGCWVPLRNVLNIFHRLFLL